MIQSPKAPGRPTGKFFTKTLDKCLFVCYTDYRNKEKEISK